MHVCKQDDNTYTISIRYAQYRRVLDTFWKFYDHKLLISFKKISKIAAPGKTSHTSSTCICVNKTQSNAQSNNPICTVQIVFRNFYDHNQKDKASNE